MSHPSETRRARYIMIGGFLGAGKSTAIVRLAERLTDRGERVGLITNDQGHDLVDTAFMQSRGFPVEEIAGGCFCCRFDSLKDAADRLSEASRPDVFIAEPVGSCTDLLATVGYPLRRLYGDAFRIAPLSVMLDPVRAMRIFGLTPGRSFSSKVAYIYKKQIEEADVIVINKSDLVEAGQIETLRRSMGEACPNAHIVVCSARNGDGLEEWFDRITQLELQPGAAVPLDYDIYAEGEALLGWLNATLALSTTQPVEGHAFLQDLASALRDQLARGDHEIAHLKATLAPDDNSGELAVVNLVRNDVVPEASQSLLDPVTHAELVLNLRAEADPDVLQQALTGAIAEMARQGSDVSLTLIHVERFKPARPIPVHREAAG